MMRKTGIESIDRDTERYAALQKRSDESKTIIGKMFTVSVADGAAIYTVEAEKGKKVQVKWHDIHDAWTAVVFGQGGWFPRNIVEPLVNTQDGMRKIFEEAGNAQDKARKIRGASVVAAALDDLGKDAEILDLAGWCWRRGHWGKLSDARIDMQRKVLGNTGAGDLAHDLLDSKAFSALRNHKKEIDFVVLADGIANPLVHKNAPPSHETIMEAVRKAFEENFGIVPRFEIIRVQSERLDDTSFRIVAGNLLKTVGTVYYDAETAKITSIHVAFEKEFPRK